MSQIEQLNIKTRDTHTYRVSYFIVINLRFKKIQEKIPHLLKNMLNYI